jgi:hypothetical protein
MFALVKRVTKRPLIAGGVLSAAIVLMALSGAALAQQAPATSAWPVLEIASPSPGAVVSTGDFVVVGSAFDPAATTGSGISHVDLFLGDRDQGGLFLGSAIPGQDALQGLTAGSDTAASSFSVTVTMPTTLMGGSRDFHAYAYSSLTGKTTDVSMPVYIGLAPTPMATPAVLPVPVANVAHMQPAVTPETFSLGNPSAGDVVGFGDYVVTGAVGPTVDRVSVFLGDRDTGGIILGTATPVQGKFTLTVTIPTTSSGGHMFTAYAYSSTTGQEAKVSVPVYIGAAPTPTPRPS